MPGSKQKLTITQWDVAAERATGTVFRAMLNPSGYSRGIKINYVNEQPIGKLPPEKKYAGIGAESLELEELVLDGTGAAGPGPNGAPPPDVLSQVNTLKRVAYEPPPGVVLDRPVVEVIWDNLRFLGRVETMTVKYTLFKPSGEPLRARVKLTFVEFITVYNAALAIRPSAAAAMARQVQVPAGASLPLMCFQVYQNAALYMAVARANDLTSFRALAAGATLLFPALR
jgi:hypothetical protein